MDNAQNCDSYIDVFHFAYICTYFILLTSGGLWHQSSSWARQTIAIYNYCVLDVIHQRVFIQNIQHIRD
jgi:hypothetical protein